MQFTFTKTNGQAVVVAVTNQSASDSVTLAAQLYNAINANPPCRAVTVLWPGITR